MIGMSLVEDFAAVILLSILSSVASTGTASLGDVGRITGKLGLFSAGALVFGALVAPRVMGFVSRLGSRETLLVAGLATVFGLALLANWLGISAAAGAFLIGAVPGDSDQAEQISEAMAPVRDLFAALFFVSVGMLVDVSQFGSFLVPALAVSAVFIVGKIVVNTVATFFAGHDGRTSTQVGMSMPQTGEFSLAMAKVGADHSAASATLYPVITVTTAVTSLVYPFVFRSADRVTDMMERWAPDRLRRYVDHIHMWLLVFRNAFTFDTPLARQIQRSGRLAAVNLMDWRSRSRGIRSGGGARRRAWRRDDVRLFVRDSLVAGAALLIAIWAIPFVSQL
ncbi:MAG: cation:proton antiporter, partial [Gemmatimonadetes bacterium]|nr:cation:proton antiporter [Gemmatimonadota bacterium]